MSGLVGLNWKPVIRSFSAGAVEATASFGGLIGENAFDGEAIDAYWDAEASDVSGSAGGEGKATADMQRQETFENWKFTPGTGVWQIDEGEDYPDLQNNPRSS